MSSSIPDSGDVSRTSTRGNKVNTSPMASIFLQLVIELQWKLQIAFLIYMTVAFFYKAYKFNYNDLYFWLEMIGLWLLTTLEFFRLFLGSKGNKQERSGLMVGFIFLTILTTCGLGYFLYLQSFVIVLEFVFGVLILVLEIVEFLWSIYLAIEFKQRENSQ